MKIYYVGVMSTAEYEELIVTEDKYFLKKESALKHKKELEADEDGWIKEEQGMETFFEEIDVIED
ncbi:MULTISPECIES: hypothetical protein [Bacillus]|uniref:hypothetical protein n=1 Tax=Bacillus TaxID=1386 RepID=UPI000BEDDF0D|nr:hypothetical protein [Bacillus cereus]PEC81611.1 hypothetical protein CON08_00460 [Bacillus cereus]